MRGKERASADVNLWNGITPACAGKSFSSFCAAFFSSDHPRVCGEKPFLIDAFKVCWGSPPRVRGKAHLGNTPLLTSGITPAYAGKRAGSSGNYSTAGDHPRVCGEKLRGYAKIWNEWGSPPRMRGKDGVNDSAQAVTGITPAYAGKRQEVKKWGAVNQDHPRVCGEKFTSARGRSVA